MIAVVFNISIALVFVISMIVIKENLRLIPVLKKPEYP